MFRKIPFWSGFVAALLAGSVSVFAQVRVQGTAGAKWSVSAQEFVPGGGALSRLAVDIVKLDLQRSGWTALAPQQAASVQLSGRPAEGAGGVAIPLKATDAGGNVVFQRTYTAQASAGAVVREAHRAADEFVTALTKKKTFLQARLACLKRDGTMKTVQVGDSAMRAVSAIRQPGAQSRQETCVRPRWSYDNRKITFTAFLRRFPDVYAWEAATGSITALAQYPGMNTGGAISPDGRSMAVILSKDGNPDLYVKDLASGQLRRLTNTRGVSEGSPGWSPDGQQIVYVSDASRTPQLYVISRNGGQPRQLTSGAHSASPDWGSNGLIAYQTQQGRNFQIAVIDPNTRQSRVVTPFDASYEDPSWAPDGRHIAAARVQNYQSDIALIDTAAGGDPPTLLTSGGIWSSPAWTH